MQQKPPGALLCVVLAFGIAAAHGADQAAPSPTSSKLVIHADLAKDTISSNIYGHFSEHLGRCIYEGIWVGTDSPIATTRGIRSDVVAALKQLKIPVLRWPGGCFADEYHWKDGIGPRANVAADDGAQHVRPTGESEALGVQCGPG